MSDYPPLSREELDFIQKTLDSSPSATHPEGLNFRLDGDPQANALLGRLARQAQLSLEARAGGQRLHFPLRVGEDEFHTLHLHIGAPTIVEEGPTQRPWRLHLESPLPLLDDEGVASGLRVHQLSPYGLLVSSPMPAPQFFTLWLPLPGNGLIPAHGQRVRSAGRGLTAYRLFDLETGEPAERLRQFLFRRHRAQQSPALATS